MLTTQLGIGFLLGGLIGLLAWRAGALSRGGAVGALLTGGLIFGLGGIPWAALLLTFFVSSSALSRLFARRKAALDEKFAKGSRRDLGQVLANGGLGALLALGLLYRPEAGWLWAAYTGAMAAVNADTWATELGVLNPNPPRLITSGKLVERGSSGGVSPGGYLAALGGSALVGLVGAAFQGGWTLLLVAIAGGLAGSSFDSLLGATVQAIYTCPACRKETERHPLHTCGASTTLRRGWAWMNNDLVNFLCSLAGAAAAAGLWCLLQ